MKLDLYDYEISDDLGEAKKKDKVVANIRLVSSFAVLIMIIGFSVFYQTNEYISLIICITGLVSGRFLYFDTTIQGIKNEITEFVPYLIYMVFAILLTVILVGIGIDYAVIETDNLFYSIFVGHICILIFIKVKKNIIGWDI